MIVLTRKTHTAMLTLLLLCILIFCIGCHHTPNASEMSLGYYNLIIKQDPSVMISFGMPEDTAATIIVQIHETLKTEIKEELSMAEHLTIDDTQIESIESAYLSALQKLNATATAKKSGKAYTITLSTTYMDFTQIDEEATALALKEVDISHYTDEKAYLSDLTTAYIHHLTLLYDSSEPTEETNQADFTFIKQNGLWLPEDNETFITTLCNLVNKVPT